ncbi:MAG TPA: hypothetical protein VK779_11885 [Rhizomicrobium sp.]|nr:hypothetical protein [Rhizomicrobium sp.]
MRRYVYLTGGWALVAGGVVCSPLPVPVPIGAMMMLAGATVLTTHSKMCRRALMFARHKSPAFSRVFEFFAKRGPEQVKHMMHHTRPHHLVRHERIRARRV